jgi:hypothetical protein
MKEIIKWSRDKTNELITLKHSEKYAENFEIVKNKPKALQILWEQLTCDLGFSGQHNQVKIKWIRRNPLTPNPSTNLETNR